MTIIIRKANGEIKTYMEKLNGHIPEDGETVEDIETPFNEYVNRLQLSIGGALGRTIEVPVGSPDVTVSVLCPNQTSVDLLINDLKETIPLEKGAGSITLSCAVAGVFVISPADWNLYFPGGEAVAVLEVK